MSAPNTNRPSAEASALPAWLSIVRSKVAGLRYGVVQITVHDGRVVQIDRTERTRVEGAGASPDARC